MACYDHAVQITTPGVGGGEGGVLEGLMYTCGEHQCTGSRAVAKQCDTICLCKYASWEAGAAICQVVLQWHEVLRHWSSGQCMTGLLVDYFTTAT